MRTITSYGKCEFFELLRNVVIQHCYHPWILVYDLRADLVTHKMGVSWTRCWRTSYVTSWSTDSRHPCRVLQSLFKQYPSRRVLSFPILVHFYINVLDGGLCVWIFEKRIIGILIAEQESQTNAVACKKCRSFSLIPVAKFSMYQCPTE